MKTEGEEEGKPDQGKERLDGLIKSDPGRMVA